MPVPPPPPPVSAEVRPAPKSYDLGKYVDVVQQIDKIMVGLRKNPSLATPRMLIPNPERYASKWGAGINTYWTRFDEALRDNWNNAIVLTRNEFVYELMRHRQWPVVGLSWHIEVDDEKDPDQKKTADRITKLVNAIPNFQSLRLYLSDHLWFGKYGAQVQWGKVRVDGRLQTTIVDHEPVNGDSIVYKYDKTPGIMVRADFVPSNPRDNDYIEDANESWVQSTDRGRALFLYDQYWRDHFIIANFEPYGPDYLFEGDKAAAIFGLGLRGRLYWALENRETLRMWLYDALQRIGVNGMLYAFFDISNLQAAEATLLALKMLIRDNVTAFPFDPSTGRPPEKLEHIEPSNVGYEVLFKELERLEECMRRAVLGQSLSGQAESTGMGSEVANLHRSTREHIIRYDADCQQQCFNRDLIGPMIRMNQWEWRGETINGGLPFSVRLVYDLDKANAQERSAVIGAALEWGMEISKEATYKDLGLSPPKDPNDVLKVAPQGPGGPGMPPVPGANGHKTLLDAARERHGLPPIRRKTLVQPGIDLPKVPKPKQVA